MVCRTSFLSRQSDVIASFSFGVWLCTRKNLLCQIFCFLHLTFYSSDIFSTYIFCINNMASPGQRRGKCGHAMALFDTHTHSRTLVAEKRVRAKIFVSRIRILLISALFASPSPMINVFSLQHLPIKLK